jgi:hypothetical protein
MLAEPTEWPQPTGGCALLPIIQFHTRVFHNPTYDASEARKLQGTAIYLLNVDKFSVLVLEQRRDERIQHVLHACPLQPGKKQTKLV